MKRYMIMAAASLALVLPSTSMAHAATPQTAVTLALHSGAKLTLVLPANVRVATMRSSTSTSTGPVPADSGPALDPGGRPLASTINATNPSNGAHVPVNTQVYFAYSWSGGGFCCETFTSYFSNNRGLSNQAFDTYGCNVNCASGSHSFTHLFATTGVTWYFTVRDQNGHPSNTVTFYT